MSIHGRIEFAVCASKLWLPALLVRLPVASQSARAGVTRSLEWQPPDNLISLPLVGHHFHLPAEVPEGCSNANITLHFGREKGGGEHAFPGILSRSFTLESLIRTGVVWISSCESRE